MSLYFAVKIIIYEQEEKKKFPEGSDKVSLRPYILTLLFESEWQYPGMNILSR